MNKTSIEWADYTVNPIVFPTVLADNRGCFYRCPYCYVQKFSKRYAKNFMPGFFPERIKGSMTNATIFVESIGDLFHPNVHDHEIETVLEACATLDSSNTIVFLTKNPERYAMFLEMMQSNFVLGFTMETDIYTIPNFNSYVKWPFQRAEDFIALNWDGLKWISYEPMMKARNEIVLSYFKRIKPDWIAFGANSVPSVQIPEPTIAEVYNLTIEARRYCRNTIFKANLERFDLEADFYKIKYQTVNNSHSSEIKGQKMKRLEDYF
jgi:protein gp37